MKYKIIIGLLLSSLLVYAQKEELKTLKGIVSEYEYINSTILNKKFRYRVYLPPNFTPNKKLPVVYVNDGNQYIKKGKTPQVVDSLIVNNIIKPVVIVFLEPRNGNDNWKNIRNDLFWCNDLFVAFFTKEFIPQIEEKYNLKPYRKERTLLGLSFGGLATAYIAHKAPKMFRNIAMQSPAFHPCPDIYGFYAQSPKKDFKIYLSYGTLNDTMEQDLPMIEVLKYKGYKLKVTRVEKGTHRWWVWRPQIADIFSYFFKK